MKTPPFEPVRFLDLRGQGDAGKVAHLIRQSIGVPEVPLPRLKNRIRQTLRRKSASRRRHLRALLVGGAIFVSGGVVGAVVQPILRLREQPKLEVVETVTPIPPSRRPRVGRLPARLPSVADPGVAVPEGTDETTGVPGMPLPEQSHQNPNPAPAPEPASALPTTSRAPEPARIQPPPEPAPARAARPAGNQRTESRLAMAKARALRAQEVHRGGDSMSMAMREPPARWPAALEPAPLQPSSVPDPVPLAGTEPGRAPGRISPVTAVAPIPKPAPSAPGPSAGPPASEQALLASAIRGLRVQRSPATALAALDEYQARYPQGSMLAEVARLRAEALLLLGQRRAALDELSRAPGTGTAADEESRLVRGELAASAERWPEALRDFDALVTAWTRAPHGGALSPKLRTRLERALWGRACARSQMGDEAGARADLQELLLRFPQGRFAAQAARRLGEPR